jgi:hypothetical protein
MWLKFTVVSAPPADASKRPLASWLMGTDAGARIVNVVVPDKQVRYINAANVDRIQFELIGGEKQVRFWYPTMNDNCVVFLPDEVAAFERCVRESGCQVEYVEIPIVADLQESDK